MSDQWKKFWESYNAIEPENEDDLYIQVGKTVNKAPVSKEVFQSFVNDVVEKLDLKSSDILLEMCCGNGLLTYSLSQIVQKIYAFDFTEALIDAAIKYKSNDNIEYVKGNAKEDFTTIFKEELPEIQKFLINDSTSYFTPEELEKIIERITTISKDFKFYLTNVPNNENKWNFYNTPERKANYEKAVQSGDIFLGGIGRWWEKSEFIHIAEKFNLKIEIFDMNNEYSYRMSVLLSTQD
ncbi:hypothetical protein ASG22_12550 [Chryseobacterium sp. Leaf405]|uniref:class I SAM-dependent methyltransferase n=1 Tax=Chryseobacterium sp. Leaf405 TaxID=1736367 RepID=UPI0006F25718|nr:class I SAM-dependent methyltransferase [Chryseobacterium sp. Leaf405]KQT23209.1 hypothetical protein ASG22_12550 [Chryseobacterium sp. Leaf405]